MKFCKTAFLSIFAATMTTDVLGSGGPSWLRGNTRSLNDNDATCEKPPFYAIAHMTNLVSTAEWGLEQGANALEMDLNFDTWKFHHGFWCDCRCQTASMEGICSLKEPVCTGSTDVDTMFDELAKPEHRNQLAMVYVDSKIDSIQGSQTDAGKRVAEALEHGLFGRGYEGIAIVSAPKLSGVEYLKAAADAIKASPYEGRVFYNIDQETNVVAVLEALVGISPYRTFATGISACSSGTYYDQIQLAAYNYAAGVISLPPGIWTIDKMSSMEKYIDFGARAIMTNKPASAVRVSGDKGYTLAAPSFRPGKATSDDIIRSLDDDGCDCDYHKGGCTISKPARSGRACRCKYMGAWTCKGDVVPCACEGSEKCKSPDDSVQSCIQGGGDCGGYSGDSDCDCDYHKGGCSISKAAPKHSACKCNYKGARTCGGEVVRCSNEASPQCENPDKSKESCQLGGGDCGAYH